MISPLVARGVGFSPRGVRYIPTLGLSPKPPFAPGGQTFAVRDRPATFAVEDRPAVFAVKDRPATFDVQD